MFALSEISANIAASHILLKVKSSHYIFVANSMCLAGWIYCQAEEDNLLGVLLVQDHRRARTTLEPLDRGRSHGGKGPHHGVKWPHMLVVVVKGLHM